METITFYSYKGGVGRTLTLANIAMYLSRFGLNVCLLDFDLEAPGLHYKFTQYLKTDDFKAGLVDYIYEFTHNDIIPESFIPFSKEIIPKTGPQGEIRLIPAGNVLSAEYWKKLASINWHKLFYEEDSEGVPFFLELKERIEKEFNPDFLLIDSRTGITEMSGVCTVLLPDKIVFLIVNNQENIEGARQIFRSIQKAERLPEQKQIEFVFALTRIPFIDKDRSTGIEERVIKHVTDSFNENASDLKSHINIQDINIIHSDRELELSESLRFGKGRIDRERSLTYDYLKLFLKIIPKDIILPKIDSILDSLVSGDRILDNPDQVQKELEELYLTLKHPKILEKLIDFYILRKVETGKILDRFDNLWKIFGIDNPKILSKYISFFLDWDFNSPRIPNFDIVIEGIDLDPSNRFLIVTNLLKAYKKYAKNSNELLQYYYSLIDKDKDKVKILNLVIDDIIEDNSTIAVSLIDKYIDIVSSDVDLRIKRVGVNFIIGKSEELLKLLNEEWVSTKDFLDKEPNLFFSVMEVIGKEQIANSILNKYLEKALQEEDHDELYRVFTIYYKLDRKDELQNKIAKNDKSESSVVQKVLEELDIDGAEDDIPF
jgi:MinD-like ATPase involved in chromosome partitioning or flagellar assembly